MCGVASQKHYIGQVHRIFNLWPMLFNQLPDDVILRIFNFISFHLIRRTISLVCKKVEQEIRRLCGDYWARPGVMRKPYGPLFE